MSPAPSTTYYPNQGSSAQRYMEGGNPEQVTYANQGSSKWGSMIHLATGAWRAASRRPNGRDLIDLTGRGRDLLMGGKSSAYLDGQALVLPGLVGNYASVPDSAALDITGDIDLRVDVALDDWTTGSDQGLIGKWGSPNKSYILAVSGTGTVRLYWSTDGSATSSGVSTAAVSASDGGRLQVRVTLDVNNGASGYDLKFWTRAAGTDLADDTGWSQLGSTVTGGAATSIYAGAATLEVGRYSAAESDGKFYGAVIKDGIDGSTALDVDFSDAPAGTDPFVCSTGQTVTVNSTVTTNDPRVLPHDGTRYMFLDGVAGNYASVPDEAALDITGDIDLRVKVATTAPTTGTLIAKESSSVSRGYRLELTSSKVLRSVFSDNGSTQTYITGGTVTADGTARWYRVTWRQSDGRVQHFTSTDGTSWSQVGSDGTWNAGGSIYSNSANVTIGAMFAGISQPTGGGFYRAQVLDGIGGTTVLDVDFTDQSASSAPYTTVTAATGQTVTLNGRATLVTSERLFLDGVDDFLSVADHADFDIGATDDFSVVTVWKTPVDIGGTQAFVNKKADNTNAAGWQIRGGGTNLPLFKVADGTNFDQGTLSAPDRGFHVMAGVLSNAGADLTFTMDGTPNADTSHTAVGDHSNAERLEIGRSGAAYMSAEFSGVAIFKGRALTAAEIAQVGRELAYGEASVA